MITLTIESGQIEGGRIIYGREPIDSLPMSANVSGIDVDVSVSQSESDSLKVTLDYNDETDGQCPYGPSIFDPIPLDSLPTELNNVVKIGIERESDIDDVEAALETILSNVDADEMTAETIIQIENNAQKIHALFGGVDHNQIYPNEETDQ